MRYVFILIMSMSFPAHAEWTDNGDNVYSKDLEWNPTNQRVSVQFLIDDDDADGQYHSLVVHMQYQCDKGVLTKERVFWYAHYEGRMGTGNVDYHTNGAPWLPHKENRLSWITLDLCAVLYDVKPKPDAP